MICLDVTDTLEAWSGTDAVVDYTVHGLVGTTFTQLAAGVLGNVADVPIYTAAAAVSVVSVIFVNTDTSAATVNFRLDPADGGNPRYLFSKAVSLGPAHSLHTDGARISIFNPTGALVYTYLAHTHDGDTLQPDAIVSDGGAFPFTTSGPITYTQNLIIPDSGNIGSVSDPDAVEISAAGILTFSGQSACRVHMDGNQTVAAGVPEIAEFDVEDWDVQNEFNPATYALTAIEPGQYFVYFQALYSVTADQDAIRANIYKNAASVAYNFGAAASAGSQSVFVTAVLDLAASDTVSFYFLNSTNNDTINAGTFYTYAVIQKIG